MEKYISANTVIFLLLLAILLITAFLFPNTSLNLSLINTILFCYGYFLLIAKVYKSLQTKKFLKYSLITLLVLLFLPFFILTVLVSGEAALKIRLHGFKSKLTGFRVPPDSQIIDSKFKTYFPGASDSLRGFQVIITLKTNQSDEALQEHYDVSQQVLEYLQRYNDLQDIIAILGVDELSKDDQVAVARARRLERFFSQPFTVTKQFTGLEGRYVSTKESVQSCKEKSKGKH